MSDMKASITLGVQAEIENLQQVQKQLQDALQHVNPDTKMFSSLNKMLQKTAQALQQLAIDSEKPFSKQSQIDSFENKFLNVSGALAQIGRELGNIDFSQLKLTEEQQNEFNKLEKDLENAQKAASNLSTDKLKTMAQDSQELANSLQEFGVNINTDTLESAFDKLNNQITKMIQRFNELETKKQEALANVDTAKTKTNNAERFLRFLQADNKTDQYNAAPEMFTKNGKYLGAGMKSNTRDNFLRSLGFDEDTIKEIGERGSKNLEELQEKLITATEEAIKRLRAEQEKVEKATEKTITSIDAKEQTQQAQIDRARAAQGIIQTTKDAEGPGSYKESQEKATKNIEAREKALDDFKAAAVEAAPAVKKAAEANEQLDSSMEGLRGKTEGASESLKHLTERAEKLNTIKNAIANWMGFYQVLNLIRNAVRYVIEDIRGLDKVMTEIAVVTNMTQKDLWGQMNTYQAIAREYAVSTQGVYQVSQIYYQQGLQTAEVMELTVETLKMAKIANLDYSKAADYMTVAIRGFHLEMDQASHIVDVYSKIAAVSASDTNELATAMSKTASSAAAVGSSFENTTAFIALMVETTRESAENIGSALKSIISRYGELKTSPDSLIDSEGEAMSFNKVETALQSVGISMHDVNGQFRDFDDVIIELSSKWDTLDMNTQRYIATVMAGNRQQSRFIALVSDYDRLSELVEEAANADDAATLQTLKTMDSLESKIQNLKNAWQGFYANLGLEEVFKGALSAITTLINRLNSMPKLFGKVPVIAVAMISSAIKATKLVMDKAVSYVVKAWKKASQEIEQSLKKAGENAGQSMQQSVANGGTQAAQTIEAKSKQQIIFADGSVGDALSRKERRQLVEQQLLAQQAKRKKRLSTASSIMGTVGSLSAVAAQSISDEYAGGRGLAELGSFGLQAGGAVVSAIAGNWPAAISMALQSVPTLIAAIDDLRNKEDKYIAALGEKIKKQEQEVLVAKNEAKTLAQSVQKLEQLRDAQYTSNEAYEEYIEYQNTLADQYPQIVAMYDAQGNAVLDYARTYAILSQSIQEATKKELELQKIQLLKRSAELEKTSKIISSLESFTYSYLDGFLGAEEGSTVLPGLFSTGYLEFTPSVRQAIFGSRAPAKTQTADTFWESIFSQENNTEVADFVEAFLRAQGVFSDNNFLQIAGFDSKQELDNSDIIKRIQSGEAESEDITWFYEVIKSYLKTADEIAQNNQKIAELEKLLSSNKNIINEYIDALINQENSILAGYESSILGLLGQNDTFATLIISGAKGFYNDEDWMALEDDERKKLVESATNQWISIYKRLGEEGYNDLIEILSHPERYATDQDFYEAINNTESLKGIFTFDGAEDALAVYWKDNINKQIEQSRQQFIDALKRAATHTGQYENDSFTEGSIYQLLNDNANRIKGELQPFFLGFAARFADGTAIDQKAIESLLNAIFSDDNIFNLINTDEFFEATKDVDWTDRTSVDNFIKSVEDAQSGFLKTLQESGLFAEDGIFVQYWKTLGINLNTFVNEFEQELQTQLESAQKIIENQSKGIKSLTDARAQLESLNTLLGTDYSFDDAYNYDATLQGYILDYNVFNQLLAKKLETDSATYAEFDAFVKSAISNINGAWAELDTSEAVENYLSNEVGEDFNAVSAEFLHAWAARDAEDTRTMQQFYNDWQKDYYERIQTDIEAQRQLLLGELTGFLEIDKVLAGQAPEDYESRVYTYVSTAIPQTVDKWWIARRKLTANLMALAKGTVDDINATTQILMDLGYDERSARDETLNLQIRNAQKQYDVLQKLLSAQQGDSIRLTAEEIEVLTKVGIEGIDDGVLETSAENFTGAVQALVQSAIDLYNKGAITLAEQNKAIIQGSITLHPESDFNTNAFQVLASNMGNLTADSLAEITAAFELDLGELDNFDIKSLEGIIYEGGNIIVSDMDAFLESLFKAADSDFKDYVKAHAHDYKITEAMQLEAMSKNVDTLISSETAIIDGAAKELQNLSKAESGKSYNLTYLTHVLGESVTNVLAGALKGAGIATLENGILKINPGQNVVDVLQHITDVITAAGLDDAEIQAAVAEIQDAIVGMLDSIINLFSNGLEGKLSNADKLNLETMATQYGFTSELTFTETAEGLKLSAESAQELAFHLQKVAGVKGQLVFDAYAKSLQETSSSYKDIFATEKTILQLTKELEAVEDRKDTNAIASLKQQLQLAQQIALIQMSDTDSYAFMDKKLPTDFAGPTNYWDSVDKMYSSLAEASKTGYLSTEDFYNMMMAANDMAAKVMEETGEKMTFMGRELDGQALTAAQLIQEGFEHLEHVDGKGLMVSLKGFGVDFAAGAKAMGGDFEKGMKEFAKTQIKLLDGLIAFMETIVAMEQLEDIDDKDGILSFEELFPKLSDGTAYANKELIEIIQGWQENEELWKQFEQIRFTDSNNSLKSFDKWLEDAIDDGKMAEADAKRLQTILNTLYQLQNSGDWDMTDIAGTVASMQELLSNTDFEGDIQIGNMQFTVSGGYTIAYELDEEGNPIWTVGNKEFNSWEDAIKQQKLVDFGAKLSEGTFELSENENFVATYTLEGATIKVDSSSGTPLYLDNFGGGHKTLEEALRANYQKEIVELGGEAEFEEYLSMLGLKLEGGEIKINGEEAEEPATIVKNAAESLTTATNENTTAINKLTDTIGKFVDLTPKEETDALDTTPVDPSTSANADAALAEAQASFAVIEAELTAKIAEIEAAKAQELAAAAAEHEAAIQALTEAHAADIERLADEYLTQKKQIEDRAKFAIETAQRAADAEKAKAWADAQSKIAEAEKEFNSMLEAAKTATEAAEAEAAAAKAELEAAQAKGTTDAATIAELESKLAEAEAKANAASIEEQHVENVVREGTADGFGYLHVDDSSFGSDTVEGIIADMLGYIQESVQEGIDTKSIIKGLYAKFDKDAIDSYFSEGSSLGKTLEEYIKSLQPESQFGHLGGGLQDRITQGSDTIAPSLAEVTEENTEAQENATKEFQNLVNLFNEHAYDIYSSGKPDAEIISSDNGLDLQDILEQLIGQQLSFKLGDFDSFAEHAYELQEYLAGVGLQFKNITMDSGTIIPQLEICEEALQEVGIEAQSSGKKMHKGRKDIQTASADISSAISTAASSLANGLNTIVRDVSNVADSLNNIKINLPQITGSNNSDAGLGKGNATGSFGNALAAGTLMGELGPELWVSHGHYYVAGQNGAEFVNLPDDAIVFNHLQTERLLGKGKAGGHGKPVTNERKATSLATGNVHGGLAMASASDTLAQLKQLRAMWEAIAKMSVSDLGKKAGSGGGGGGGDKNNKAFIHDLERWFSLEQEILRLEKAITKEQKTRAVLMSDQVINGEKIYASYRREYENLKDRINATQELANLQRSYYEKRQEDLNKSLVSQIFTFDENGVMKYKGYGDERPGSMGGLDILATLNRTGPNNEPIGPNGQKWDAGGQVDFLTKALAVSKDDLKASLIKEGAELGEKATDEDILQAWYDLMDSYQSELTELYDSWTTHEDEVLEMQADQNQIIQDIIDNQLSLEQRVLTALIDQAQKAIDDLQDSRDALADANQKYIDGLNDSLQKQRDMYDRNESTNELNKLQRQLAILQRSGGSASQIRSLQQQIGDQMQDAYFTAQQDQIDAIKEATDKQIERLDYQIDLMTKTLEYQEENGLLWRQVYDKMNNNSPEQLLSFIMDNTASMRGQSTRQTEQDMIEIGDEIGIYKGDLIGVKEGNKEFEKGLSEEDYTIPQSYEEWKALHDKNMEDLKEMYDKMLENEQEIAQMSNGSGSGSGFGGGSGTNIASKSNNSNKTNITKPNDYSNMPVNPNTVNTKNEAGNTGNLEEQYGFLVLHYLSVNNTPIKSPDVKRLKAGKVNVESYKKTIAGYKFQNAFPQTVIVPAGGNSVVATLYYRSVQIPPQASFDLGSGFANGGLVDYTGSAQVHGSKSKPESFFDAQSTAILRDDVLGSINVLDSLLADVSTAGTNSLNLGANESLSIANPVININVDKIANDYDAKRAGQLAFDEMVKIARQSGNRSLSRR